MSSDLRKICLEQIALLKEKSSERALTTEEVRNLETLTKTLKMLGDIEEKQVLEEDEDYSEAIILEMVRGGK